MKVRVSAWLWKKYIFNYRFLFDGFFACQRTRTKESAGSAQYKIKRLNFLIYLHIAPGNFSLLAQRKVAEKEMPKFVAHKRFSL